MGDILYFKVYVPLRFNEEFSSSLCFTKPCLQLINRFWLHQLLCSARKEGPCAFVISNTDKLGPYFSTHEPRLTMRCKHNLPNIHLNINCFVEIGNDSCVEQWDVIPARKLTIPQDKSTISGTKSARSHFLPCTVRQETIDGTQSGKNRKID